MAPLSFSNKDYPKIISSENKSKYERWKKYSTPIYLLLKGDLGDFEREFLSSVNSYIYDGMSEKQENLLRKILIRHSMLNNK
jgi:hypothetical protein